MADRILDYELTCSICLDIYTTPVMLDCGHNFCRRCIEMMIEEQMDDENYSCPKCRRIYSYDFHSQVNFNLSNIAEYYKSIKGCESPEEVPCTYCILIPSTATRTCLHCEASFCDKHLELHSKSKEHILVDPTASIRSRKCLIHDEVFKYYCVNDQACICPSCCLSEHKDHDVELLEEAVQKEKEQLKTILQGLKAERESCKEQEGVWRGILKKRKEKVAQLKNDLEALSNEFRERIVVAHVDVVNEIGRHLREVSEQLSNKIFSEFKRAAESSLNLDEGSLDEGSSSTMDALCVLQALNRHNISAANSATGDRPSIAGHFIDTLLISLLSQKYIRGVSDSLPLFLASKFEHLKYKVDLLLNAETASKYLSLSDDLKTLSYTKKKRYEEITPRQFKSSQVLSIQSFDSGRHFWEVESSEVGVKAVGVAYPTIERSGVKAFLGYNEKSWSLIWSSEHIEVCHASNCIQIKTDDVAMRGLGVFLDYEAGQLSFYRLCEKVKHLHTISATFTEPLHAAFYVVNGWMKINPPKMHWK
ncbi:E3 ubiquitin/ISG15 ligase TRIM25-like isoform 1-T2 [Anomaloglossus baeobatrachus]|uniref:E3 ubiquitin/ISG15 ligase TRIM25-like n=1 Tax=Anomaloglossus baeobatrachus TaxID=238106 RepID=UPI003F508412